MRKTWIALLLISALSAGAAESWVSFVITANDLPENGWVHITGNHEKLGSWNPSAVPLQKRADGFWVLKVPVETGSTLEYKFTLGSWDTEALAADGSVPPNHVLRVGGDTTVREVVTRWPTPRDPAAPKYTGTVEYHAGMAGEGILPRDVLVWLPPSYATDPERRYPVLYMHDGQQVFDPATSTHGADWGVDETATRLIAEGRLQEIIVVAATCTSNRFPEYSETEAGSAFRRFLARDLKAFIDAKYRTMPDRAHTAVMGSSMGGRVSFLLAWEYPDVYSMAGCLSPSFSDETLALARAKQEDPPAVRFYMDNGGIGLEERLQTGIDQMLPLLQDMGFEQGDNLVWFRDIAAEHNEAAWAKRVWMPLLYFFGQGPQDWIRELPPITGGEPSAP
ncbi:MAG TPA: alpha/beta hydrolase-fold protein [Kiritimatiellia bacterium]|nr:alpha/beta hydrolase-fold protein [Kiritimatiellia bacterium]HRZ12972.1 alpha/beta hydrolase-fold protein [Kiritimatiellia bacterium]HSA18418.1 alpha/beta hydrolase-fold protein [Kiritimatiellia bacterium]